MANDTQPQIFLSYSWTNKNIADEIDNDFKSVGITFQRDVRDIKYTESIKDFMNRIGKSDFVVMLISDEYIKSENCMYEVTELLNAHEFEKRILPVTLDNADIYGRTGHEKYYDYWQEKIEDVKRLLAKHPNEKTFEDRKKIQSIYDFLGIFFKKITDLKLETYENLKDHDYKQMLDKIGFDTGAILQKVIAIAKIKNIDDREMALSELSNNYRDNKYILFQKALNATKQGLYKVAKRNYELVLIQDPKFVLAINNLGLLLEKHFCDYDGALSYYQKAIKINNANYEEPYSNLGLLLVVHYSDFKLARQNLEKALQINPNHEGVMLNLANLLAAQFSEYENARKYYERVIELNPENIIGLYNYAIFLEDYFEDHENAKKLYEKIIQIDPRFNMAHNNLGLLLSNYFSDHINAKLHFEKALIISPNFIAAQINLAKLMHEHFRHNI